METVFIRVLDVLLVEDNPAEAEHCLAELRKAGFDPRVDVVQTAHEFCARLAAKAYQLVLSSYTLPSCNGLELLELLQQMDKDIPFIFITRAPDETPMAECLHKGAYDFVPKDQPARLATIVHRAIEARRLRQERNDAEMRARDYETRYHRLAELAPDAVFIVGDDKVVFANALAAQLLGVDAPEKLISKAALTLVHPDSRTLARERFERLSGTMEVQYYDDRLLRADGKPVDVKMVAAGLHYLDRPAVKLIARDTTERRRVEEAIKSLAAFAQLNPNPVMEFSRDGKLTYFNEAALEMAKSLGKDHPSAMLPADAVPVVQMCLTTGQNRLRLETSLVGRTLSWSFFPIKQNQVVHCYVTEITERLSLEAQLRHAQKLESVGRLAAGVAHDFNNILTVIQGHSGLLRAMPNLTPEMVESLQQVARAAERAGKLTGQLLTFSRKNVIKPQKLNLNEVLTNASTLLYRALGEDITFQFNYSPNLPPIYADAGMMEQVIMNLAVNARDAMPKGGQLVITTSTVDIDEVYVRQHHEARPGRFVCLSFMDTGAGLDSEALNRVFEPFFAAGDATKGSGLGLATVHAIIKRHQGWIEVFSQIGRGTTFKLFLPLFEQVSEKWIGAPEDTVIRGGNETVLVVEDEPPVRWTVKSILQRYGYRVLEAAAGVDALAVWHQHHNEIGLLLTDMIMPAGLTGQELAEKFKAQKPSLKVIYTSGYSVEVAGKGFSDLEGVSFLQKPYDAETLALTVRRCLDG